MSSSTGHGVRHRSEDTYGRICEVECKLNMGCITVISMFSLVLSMLSFSMLTLVITGYVQIGSVMLRLPVCVPIDSPGFKAQGISIRKEHDRDHYCAGTESEMSTLLSEVLTYQESIVDGQISALNFTSPHAHIALKKDPRHFMPDVSLPSPHRLYMDDTNTINADLQRLHEVTLKDTDLQIKHSALYYVYSSIHFKPFDCSGTAKVMLHSVWKLSEKNIKLELTRSEFTACCSSCEHNHINQIDFSGGVFYLEKDTRIYAEVSDAKDVIIDITSSYFGLFYLGSN